MKLSNLLPHRFMAHRSLRFKMTLVGLLSIFAAVGTAVISDLIIIRLLNDGKLANHQLMTLHHLGGLNAGLEEYRALTFQSLYEASSSRSNHDAQKQFPVTAEKIQEKVSALEKDIAHFSSSTREVFIPLTSSWRELQPLLAQWQQKAGTEEAAAFISQLASALNKMDQTIEPAIQVVLADNAKANQLAESMRAGILYLGAGSFVFFLMLGVFNYLTVRKVSDLSQKVIDDLQQQSQSLNRYAGDLKQSSENLRQSSSIQSAAVQESIAAVTEMSSMMRSSSQNAAEADNLTQSVDQESKQGNVIMENMVNSMDSIAEANHRLNEIKNIIEKIGEKTNVINDIVFKTQLLSFNASIEAARAGQMGRGFAVVAEEVGRLAESSGLASQEITNLLGNSKDQVEAILNDTTRRINEGKEVTHRALAAFSNIASRIDIVSSKVRDIAQAVKEQEIGIAQTNQAMKELDDGAQRNYGVAETTAELSGHIGTNGTHIQDMTATLASIILGSGSGTPSAAPIRPRSASSQPEKQSGKITKRASRAPLAAVIPTAQPTVETRPTNTQNLPFTADDPSFKKVI